MSRQECGFCNQNLFRYGKCHGAVDVKENISGTKTHTAYLCNLCYHLFNSKKI